MTGIGHLRIVARSVVRPGLSGALAAVLALGCVTATPHAARAATAPPLGTVTSYAVLGGSAVTNTGPTVLTGDLGVSPGSAITGFPPGLVVGAVHAADAAAAQAQADLTTAYNNAAGQVADATIATELGGATLTPGTYNSALGTFQITGELTLDAQGDPDAVFIFQAASTLVTASASTVNLINGAQACNVFWQVGSSATLGTGSSFAGNILALTSITATTGAVIDGRLLARNGAVTLDTNTVTRSLCAAPVSRETSTALAVAPTPGVPGGYTLTATVTSFGPTPPTGPVGFFDNGVSLGTAVLDANGRAVLAVVLAPGSHGLVAAFPGTALLDASVSPVVPLVVPPVSRQSATTLATAPTPGVPGGYTLTATVTSPGPNAPTGPVQFLDNGVSLGTAVLDANGRAVLAVVLAPGTHVITASFPGTALLDASASAPVTLVVPANDVPVPPTGTSTLPTGRKPGTSIRNHQHDDNVIRIKDRVRRHHHRHHCCRSGAGCRRSHPSADEKPVLRR
ncbi:ice-binding family protein [Streptosporangium sp. V21-05]|uniref:ice-binding family protein n=1 Tax=Streptosporangium sp. V21-05 TaxID=3446115 RepID=UPI003F53BD33